MRQWILGVALAAMCAVLNAAERAHSDIAQFVPAKQQVASRVDADITGDGAADTMFVSVNKEELELTVVVLMREGKGFKRLEALKLDLTPQGMPTITVKNNVLLLEHATGGNMAQTAATYRFRFDADEGRMRLIGLDAERTGSENGIKMSWNLLTGAQTVRRGKRDPAVVIYGAEKKGVQKSEKVWMSSSPDPDTLIDKFVR